jgi:hypothetical protein
MATIMRITMDITTTRMDIIIMGMDITVIMGTSARCASVLMPG